MRSGVYDHLGLGCELPEASCSCWTADDEEIWRATGTATDCWTATGRLVHCCATVLHVEAKAEREGVRAAIVVCVFEYATGDATTRGEDRGGTSRREGGGWMWM